VFVGRVLLAHWPERGRDWLKGLGWESGLETRTVTLNVHLLSSGIAALLIRCSGTEKPGQRSSAQLPTFSPTDHHWHPGTHVPASLPPPSYLSLTKSQSHEVSDSGLSQASQLLPISAPHFFLWTYRLYPAALRSI
jgi:hypothetical protein